MGKEWSFFQSRSKIRMAQRCCEWTKTYSAWRVHSESSSDPGSPSLLKQSYLLRTTALVLSWLNTALVTMVLSGRCSPDFWSSVVFTKQVSHMQSRKFFVSQTYQHASQKEVEHVEKAMCHGKDTWEKCYIRQDCMQTTAVAMDITERILKTSKKEETNLEKELSEPAEEEPLSHGMWCPFQCCNRTNKRMQRVGIRNNWAFCVSCGQYCLWANQWNLNFSSKNGLVWLFYSSQI